MNDALFGTLILLMVAAGCAGGILIGRSAERRSIINFLWGQPKTRPMQQMILDVERGAHRDAFGEDQPAAVPGQEPPRLPCGYVSQLRQIAATEEKKGYVTRISYGGMTPGEARMILRTLEILSGGNLSAL